MLFEMNGAAYETDEETLKVLRSVVPGARRSGDHSAVAAVVLLGMHFGRIELVSCPAQREHVSGERCPVCLASE